MRKVLFVVLALGMLAEIAAGQYQPPIGSTPPTPPPAKSDASPVQHGAQPSPGEMRPGSEAGDSPSAATGAFEPRQHERRVIGLPVNTAILIAGVLVVLLVIAGVIVPNARRRTQARGGGTYGRRR